MSTAGQKNEAAPCGPTLSCAQWLRVSSPSVWTVSTCPSRVTPSYFVPHSIADFTPSFALIVSAPTPRSTNVPAIGFDSVTVSFPFRMAMLRPFMPVHVPIQPYSVGAALQGAVAASAAPPEIACGTACASAPLGGRELCLATARTSVSRATPRPPEDADCPSVPCGGIEGPMKLRRPGVPSVEPRFRGRRARVRRRR